MTTTPRRAPLWEGPLLGAAAGALAVLLGLALHERVGRPWSIVIAVGVAIGAVTAVQRAWRGPREHLVRDALVRAAAAALGVYVALLLLG
jgi:hypothetical protein